MIPKVENTSEHKDQSNQSNAIDDTTSDTVTAIKVIKAMRLTIRPIILSEPSKQPKRYGQRYDQDKPGGGYILSSSYAKTRDLSKKPDAQEVDVGR